MDRALSATPAALLAGQGDVTAVFTLRDRGQADGAGLARGAAEGAGHGLRARAHRHEGRARPVAMELHDSLGGRTVLRFPEFRAGAHVDPGAFRFTPPEGRRRAGRARRRGRRSGRRVQPEEAIGFLRVDGGAHGHAAIAGRVLERLRDQLRRARRAPRSSPGRRGFRPACGPSRSVRRWPRVVSMPRASTSTAVQAVRGAGLEEFRDEAPAASRRRRSRPPPGGHSRPRISSRERIVAPPPCEIMIAVVDAAAFGPRQDSCR